MKPITQRNGFHYIETALQNVDWVNKFEYTFEWRVPN